MICSNASRGLLQGVWRVLQDLMWAMVRMVRSFDLADPVDTLVLLLGRLAQFAVGG